MQKVLIRSGLLKDIALLQEMQVKAGVIFETVGMVDIANSPPTGRPLFLKAIEAQWLNIASVMKHDAGFTLGQATGSSLHLEQMSVLPEYAQRGIGGTVVTGFH